MSRVGRRRLLFTAATSALAAMVHEVPDAAALGRTPIGGAMAMTLPWELGALDPHDLHDASGALFAHAVFDTLYATTDAGVPYPALAAAAPARDGAGVLVRLRPGLRTAAGKPIDARDVAASLERSRAAGGAAVLAGLGDVRPAPGDALALVVRRGDVAAVVRALASPLAAIVPRGFDPRRPDGTGAFRARVSGTGLELVRNESAARGAAWLDRLTARPAPDLRASLRSFEIGDDDLGWQGSGLFGRRADAVAFDLGAAAMIALVVGDRLGAHARAGGAQALCDGIPRDRLAHLGLGDLPSGEPAARWTGEPVDLCVEAGAPHLLEIARAAASSLSQPGHEVTVRAVARREVIARSRRDALGLLVVRPVGAGEGGVRVALAQVEDPGRAARLASSALPPRAAAPRTLTGALRVGVLGELRVSGAVARAIALARHPAGGWDLGATFRRPR